MNRDISFVVDTRDVGKRLDKLVVENVTGLGRRRAAELFARGHVTVNGTVATKGQPAAPGCRVDVHLDGGASVPVEPDAPLTVLLERPDLVVVDKPAGQPCAPLRGEGGTLASALIARYPEMCLVGYSPREPGMLHRLDNDTSGLVVAARGPSAFDALRRALVAGAIDKRYLAIVEAPNVPESGVIDAPIGPDPKGGAAVRVYSGDTPRSARSARTEFRVIERGVRTLLEVRVSRAYRHQIRAHLAHAGLPILGDVLYGSPAARRQASRHALHASHVAWAGDGTLAEFAATAPLPADLVSLMAG